MSVRLVPWGSDRGNQKVNLYERCREISARTVTAQSARLSVPLCLLSPTAVGAAGKTSHADVTFVDWLWPEALDGRSCHGSGFLCVFSEPKILWKTGPGTGVTYFQQHQVCVVFKKKVFLKYGLCWISVASMVAGVWRGVGFLNFWKNFGCGPGFWNFVTGAESESENVTPAPSASWGREAAAKLFHFAVG